MTTLRGASPPLKGFACGQCSYGCSLSVLAFGFATPALIGLRPLAIIDLPAGRILMGTSGLTSFAQSGLLNRKSVNLRPTGFGCRKRFCNNRKLTGSCVRTLLGNGATLFVGLGTDTRGKGCARSSCRAHTESLHYAYKKVILRISQVLRIRRSGVGANLRTVASSFFCKKFFVSV